MEDNYFTILYWFCHTSTWICHGCTRVPHPELPLPPHSPYHPSGSSQCTSPKHPVSCIEPGLVIRFIYDIIHVSMQFSQIIPPSPSPTESKRLFYTSVSLLLSHIQGYRYHLSKFHIYALVYCIGKACPESRFAFLHFFSMGMVLLPVSCTMSWTSVHSSSGTLSIWSSPLNLFLTYTV